MGLLDRQLGELLEGSSTSHLQARLSEVSPALWSEELPVQVPPTLLPTGSATSSAEVGREERVEREGKAGRLLVSLEGREARGAKARAREERVARTFSEGSTAKAKGRESTGAWMSLSLKSGSLVEFWEPLGEVSLVVL